MSTDTDRTLELTDWQAYEFHRSRMRMALGIALFGFGLVLAPLLLDSGPTASGYAIAYGSTFAFYAALLVFAYEYDGRARRLADWTFSLIGDSDYTWEAHDVEVSYRDER